MANKGWYASVYSTILDSPEYEALSRDAADVWWAFKFCPENNQPGVFVFFNEQVGHRAKVPMERVQAAIRELEAARWIQTEGRWVWIRNHLKFDPTYAPDNANHVKGLLKKVDALPATRLVADFVRYYKSIGYIPKTYRHPSESLPKAIRKASQTHAFPDAVTDADASTDTETNHTPPTPPQAGGAAADVEATSNGNGHHPKGRQYGLATLREMQRLETDPRVVQVGDAWKREHGRPSREIGVLRAAAKALAGGYEAEACELVIRTMAIAVREPERFRDRGLFHWSVGAGKGRDPTWVLRPDTLAKLISEAEEWHRE